MCSNTYTCAHMETHTRARAGSLTRSYVLIDLMYASFHVPWSVPMLTYTCIRVCSHASACMCPQVTAMLHLKEEEMAREKTALTSQFTNQLAAVHQVERAAAQVRHTNIHTHARAHTRRRTRTYAKC